MPELVGAVDNSQVTGVVIELEDLHNFNLKVKIEVFAIFSLGTHLWDILQFWNVALSKNVLLQEALGYPLSKGCDSLLLVGFEGKRFAEEGERLELTRVCGAFHEVSLGLIQRSRQGGRYLVILFLKAVFGSHGGEQGPTWIEEDVAGELLHILVSLNVGSVHTDNFTYALDDWKVLELSSEHHQGAVFNNPVLIERLVWIGNFHGADEAIRLKWFMREASIKDNCVEMIQILLSVLAAILQLGVLVFTSFLCSFDLC